MSSIAIIPARGGSKRIPRKNIRNFQGKPIIGYSIEAAMNSNVFDEIMVSTDDVEIADISKRFGAAIPFFRSPETSTDYTDTAEVLIEVLREYKKLGKNYETLCCIYPCAPFITGDILRESMEKLKSNGADSIVPVVRFSYPPQRCVAIRKGKMEMLYPENYNARSQDLEPLYHDAGQFYCITSKAIFLEEKLFCKNSLPFVLNNYDAQDIDTEDDWIAAEIKYQILNQKRSL